MFCVRCDVRQFNPFKSLDAVSWDQTIVSLSDAMFELAYERVQANTTPH
jgi:hypothetical protein